MKVEVVLRARFLCNYQNTNEKYPFGQDDCLFYLFLKDNQNNAINLKLNKTIIDHGPKAVAQFNIVGWKAEQGNFEVLDYLKAITVQVRLKLRFLNPIQCQLEKKLKLCQFGV